MDITKYFKIIEVKDHVLHMDHKGFWSDDVVEQIENTMMLEFQQAVQKALRDGPFIILADLRQLGVVSKKGRVALSRLMKYAQEHNMYKSVEIIPLAITRLSLRDAAELSGGSNFRVMTNTLEEALNMVEFLKQKMLASEKDDNCEALKETSPCVD